MFGDESLKVFVNGMPAEFDREEMECAKLVLEPNTQVRVRPITPYLNHTFDSYITINNELLLSYSFLVF